ncbi:MAG: S9 family peptidase [Magnetovibrio sp.]|nr:S9 family peptidase [Magnetovibrio sp.]
MKNKTVTSKDLPPRAEKHPVYKTYHDDVLADDYAWLRDDDWQRVMREPEILDPKIRAYLDAENFYAEALLDPLSGNIEALFAEIKGRIKEKDSSVPLPDGNWAYYHRYREGGEHPLFCRQPRGGGLETVMFDSDAEAEGCSFFKLAACKHSPDHKYLAYTLDLNGSEIYALHIRNLETGENIEDVIDGVHGAFEWSNNSRALFYTILDENHRPYAVKAHILGTLVDSDDEVYRENDPGFFVGLDKTESRRFMIIHAHDHQTSEIRILDNEDIEGGWKLIAHRKRGREYDLTDWNGALLIRTNEGEAEDFKVIAAPYLNPSMENWRDVVGHEPGRFILMVQAFADYWVRLERVNALPRIIVTPKNGDAYEIAFDEEAYALNLQSTYEFDSSILRFTYSSMTTPERTFDYHMGTRERALKKEQELPSGHEPFDYVTRRLEVTALDGEAVPVSLLYKKGIALDGSAPLLLYGYGAYGMSVPSAFSSTRLSLVDRGFVYAIAHVRGGMERGYRWYEQGREIRKVNTFSDFISVAEALIAKGYTYKGGVAAHGGSAGGMLMGAVANIASDLFGVVVAEVPFVDVLNTMLDETLPLTPPEWPEWGNPIKDAGAFNTIKAYSPYDNVMVKDYPNIYVTAGLTDPRVTYWEAAKWVAKLRALKTDTNKLLLKTNMEAGHGGASGRFKRLRETAEIYAFIVDVLVNRSSSFNQT